MEFIFVSNVKLFESKMEFKRQADMLMTF